jgi:hypothetical protein
VSQLPKQSTKRTGFNLSEEVIKKLNLLKGASGSKNVSNVVEDAINTIYNLAVVRAKIARGRDLEEVYEKQFDTDNEQVQTDERLKAVKDSMLTMLMLIDSGLEKYWKPLAKMPT